MPRFLNTEGLIREIPELIRSAEKELVIIVPYIKTSPTTFKSLKEADSNGVEITIVTRGDDLLKQEYSKLSRLKNLNILSHPTVHSKFYMNEDKSIISSINLYKNSEENNKEMGVLVRFDEFFDDFDDQDDDDFYDDNRFHEEMVEEVQSIINGSEWIKKSNNTEYNGLNISLIKTQNEIMIEVCDSLNKLFSPKKFLLNQFDHTDWIVCKSYLNKMDLIMKDIDERVELAPNKGDVKDWYVKLQPLHGLKFFVDYSGGSIPFTCYNNYGGKLNIVSYLEEEEDLEIDEKSKIWQIAIDMVKKEIQQTCGIS